MSAAALMSSCPLLRLSPSLMQHVLRQSLRSRDILAVCLTSSHLCDAGKRVLYEAPVAGGLERMEMLLNTLVDREDLALWVEELVFDGSGASSPAFLDLCARAIRATRNVVELNLTALPDLPAVLGACALPKLRTCLLTDTASATPFLEANAARLAALLLADRADATAPGLARPLRLPRLRRAVIPLRAAPLVLRPGTPAADVHLALARGPAPRAADLARLAALAHLPLTALTLATDRLLPDLVAPAVRAAGPALERLTVESARAPGPRARARFFDEMERRVGALRGLRVLTVCVRGGPARMPTPADLDEMGEVCQRLGARCPSLSLIIPGLNMYWQPFGGTWFPLAPIQDYEKFLDLVGFWTMKKLAKDLSLMAPMVEAARRDTPVQTREWEESRGVRMRNPREVPRKYGGWAEDPVEEEAGSE
ncbi:hypothetical protein HDZ31DRAFT_75627 [Schizophyllum fasciatum]